MFKLYLKGLDFRSTIAMMIEVLDTLEFLCNLDQLNEMDTFKQVIIENDCYDKLNDLANSPNDEIQDKVAKIGAHVGIEFED